MVREVHNIQSLWYLKGGGHFLKMFTGNFGEEHGEINNRGLVISASVAYLLRSSLCSYTCTSFTRELALNKTGKQPKLPATKVLNTVR